MPVDFYEGRKQVQTWGDRVLTFLGTRVFKKTAACCLMLLLYDMAAHALESYLEVQLDLPSSDTAVFGAALSILMVLRTNSAYDRWWEGRKHWGALVNTCRNLALKVEALSQADPTEKALAGRYIALFPYVLRDHLREGITEKTWSSFPEPVNRQLSHLPAYVTSRLMAILAGWREKGLLSPLDHHLIDRQVNAWMEICGACERIRNTPLPLAHRALIPQLLVLYLVVVPISLPATVANAVLTFVMGYFLIGLELVAEEIEEPFGTDDDDLQLDRLCKGIERSVRETIPATQSEEPYSDLSPTGLLSG
jgi:putative membrane protein